MVVRIQLAKMNAYLELSLYQFNLESIQIDIFFKKTHNKNLLYKMSVGTWGDHVGAFHESSFCLRLPGLAPLLSSCAALG